MIVAQPKTGNQTMLLKEIANSISANQSEVLLSKVWLVERPEERICSRRCKCKVIATFDGKDKQCK